MPININLLKVCKYVKMYGFKRTIVKIAGRDRKKYYKYLIPPRLRSGNRSISIIGCGQFSFSSIAYFLHFFKANQLLGCFDTNKTKSESLAKFYNIENVCPDVISLLANPSCKLVYIVSNHASHTEYAIDALNMKKDVYIEKPISTSFEQFSSLINAINISKNKVYVGYNRPHSKAIKELGKTIENLNKPISISCFISGHFIESDHWYRNPEEGTRVCGNMGHWIDLSIHLLNKRGRIPDQFEINISYADRNETDDNICVSISTNQNDIISIFLSSRSEPFEGINETINFQCANIIAKIDDFRKMTIWRDERKWIRKYWPKDVGHKQSILQPFNKSNRDFNEILISTLLMLFITDMVKGGKSIGNINVFDELRKLDKTVCNR